MKNKWVKHHCHEYHRCDICGELITPLEELWLWDDEGKAYSYMSGHFLVVCIGHSRRERTKIFRERKTLLDNQG